MTQTLEFPYMRANLAAYTDSLRDREHQQRVWVRHEKGGPQDSFQDIVHFFYDDTQLAEDLEACIGLYLYDQAEADAVDVLLGAMDEVLEQVGHRKPDEEYLAAPGWGWVVRTAAVLGELLDAKPAVVTHEDHA